MHPTIEAEIMKTRADGAIRKADQARVACGQGRPPGPPAARLVPDTATPSAPAPLASASDLTGAREGRGPDPGIEAAGRTGNGRGNAPDGLELAPLVGGEAVSSSDRVP